MRTSLCSAVLLAFAMTFTPALLKGQSPLPVKGQSPLPVGPVMSPESQANVYTPGNQHFAAAAVDPSGIFVVVWESAGADGDGYGIAGRRYSSSGSPFGEELAINTTTTGQQRLPTIIHEGSTGFVVAWESGSGDIYNIRARRLDSNGDLLGAEFQISQETTHKQRGAALAPNPGVGFHAAWHSDQGTTANPEGGGLDFDVLARSFDSQGNPLDNALVVNTYTTGFQFLPRVASAPSGDFTVVWYGAGPDAAAENEVAGQRLTSAGALIDGEFAVNSHTTGRQSRPDVTIRPDESFMVVWRDEGTPNRIEGRLYTSDGAAVGAEFQVNTATGTNLKYPRVGQTTSEDTELFTVVWELDGDVRRGSFLSSMEPPREEIRRSAPRPMERRPFPISRR